MDLIRRRGPVPGLCLVVSISVHAAGAEECEERVPAGFVLETTMPDRFNGAKAGEEVVMDETSMRHFAVLQLWNSHGLPVCWREVTFESHAPEQVDFVEAKAWTNAGGVVANVLVRKLGARDVDTQFTVRTGDGIEDTFVVRGIGWITDASPFSFRASPLEDFFGPLQVLTGNVTTFGGPMKVGAGIRTWSIDPRIAEPSVATINAPGQDTLFGHQTATCTVTARDHGRTVFLIETVESNTYTADIRGDIHPLFIRGDCNLDDATDLADGVFLLDSLFRGSAPFRLFEACNTNDDDALNIADAIHLLSHLFRGGPAPPPPFPEKGRDPDPP